MFQGQCNLSKSGAQLTLQPKKGGCTKSVVSLLETQKVGAQMRNLRIKLYRPCLFHHRNLAFENIQGLHTVEAENGDCQFTPWSYAPLTSIFQDI